jgi:biopolymer transport protein ExbD
MRNSSFLIRFIDIGLIILFGFVIISDITVRSHIDLPSSDPEDQEITEESELSLIVINIDPDHVFRLSDYHTSTFWGEYQDLQTLESVMEDLMDHLRDEGETPVALIEPHEDITMQSLIDVMDICDRLGLPKNINVKSMSL